MTYPAPPLQANVTRAIERGWSYVLNSDERTLLLRVVNMAFWLGRDEYTLSMSKLLDGRWADGTPFGGPVGISRAKANRAAAKLHQLGVIQAVGSPRGTTFTVDAGRIFMEGEAILERNAPIRRDALKVVRYEFDPRSYDGEDGSAWIVAPIAGEFAGEKLGNYLWYEVTGTYQCPKGSFMACPHFSNDRYRSQMYLFRNREDAVNAGVAFLGAATEWKQYAEYGQ
jgi:hypothetical protein